MDSDLGAVVQITESLLRAGDLFDALQAARNGFEKAKSQGDFDLQFQFLLLQGDAYAAIEEFGDALKLYGKARTMLGKKVCRDLAENQLVVLDKLITCEMGKRRWKRAKKLCLEALGKKTAMYGADSVQIGELHMQIGVIFMHENNYGEAMDRFEQADKAVPRDCRNYAELLNLRAVTLAKMGELANSLKIRVAELELMERLVGRMHVDFAKSLHRTAIGYAMMERYDQSIVLLEEALEIRRVAFGYDAQIVHSTEKDLKFYREKHVSAPVSERVRRNSLPLELGKPKFSLRRRVFSFAPNTMRAKVEQIEIELRSLEDKEREMAKALEEDMDALGRAEEELVTKMRMSSLEHQDDQYEDNVGDAGEMGKSLKEKEDVSTSLDVLHEDEGILEKGGDEDDEEIPLRL